MNGIGWYFASAALAGGGHCGHSAQGGQARGDVGGTAGGSSAQPARTRIAPTRHAKARTMWVIYVEMGVAFALLILIVWWTWPAKRPDGKPAREDREGERR
jgi:hypothetical protein